MGLQAGQIFFVEVYHAEKLFLTSVSIRGRRNQPLGFETVAVHQEMGYRLVIIGVCTSDIGTDKDTRLFGYRLLRGNVRAASRRKQDANE